MRGTVVRMIRDRGFGFVRCDDGTEVFFHHSSLPRGVFDTIQDGQEMDFEIENDVIRALYVVRNPDKLRHLATAQ